MDVNIKQLMYQEHTPQVNVYLAYCFVVAVLSGALYSNYLPTFDFIDYGAVLVPAFLFLLPFQWITGGTLPSKAYIAHALVGCGWAFAFSLPNPSEALFWGIFKAFTADYVTGLGLFVSLTLTHFMVVRKWNHAKLFALLFTALDFLLLVPVLGQILYLYLTSHSLSSSAMLALYQTNTRESFEYLYSQLGATHLFSGVLSVLLLLLLMYVINLQMKARIELQRGLAWLWPAILLCLAITFPFFLQTGPVSLAKGIQTYANEMSTYQKEHAEIYKQLPTLSSAKDTVPGTIILVIGESANRDYMGAFNTKAPFPTDTPWESQQKKSHPHFYFFPQAYSSWVQTVPVLTLALSESNQYNQKPLSVSPSLLDIAKKAGYHTYWFSNQGVVGTYDTPISLIAKTADIAVWTPRRTSQPTQYDAALLPLLKTVSPHTNNFIVLHLMGSHQTYEDRYPDAARRFDVGKTNDIAHYSNTLAYTDEILKDIYTYAKEHLHLQAMIYVSDHSEDIGKGHNPDIFSWTQTHIPLWIYLSAAYQNAYPLTATTLKDHENRYWTNDLLYDLIVGILQAPTTHYQKPYDLSQPDYAMTKHTLVTMHGAYTLSQDPSL